MLSPTPVVLVGCAHRKLGTQRAHDRVDRRRLLRSARRSRVDQAVEILAPDDQGERLFHGQRSDARDPAAGRSLRRRLGAGTGTSSRARASRRWTARPSRRRSSPSAPSISSAGCCRSCRSASTTCSSARSSRGARTRRSCTNGRVDFAKLPLVVYVNGEYWSLGERIGAHGFSMHVMDKRIVLLIATIASFVTPFMASAVNIALPTIGKEFSMTGGRARMGGDRVHLRRRRVPRSVRQGSRYLRQKEDVSRRHVDLHDRVRLLRLRAFGRRCSSRSGSLQGIGASMTFSTGVAIVTSVVPAAERGRALGITTAAVYLGLSLGPVVGGLLTQHFGWRSIFLVTVPLGLARDRARRREAQGGMGGGSGERFDLPGALSTAPLSPRSCMDSRGSRRRPGRGSSSRGRSASPRSFAGSFGRSIPSSTWSSSRGTASSPSRTSPPSSTTARASP